MYAVLMALVVIHMTAAGMEQQHMKFKYNIVFESKEKCNRWLNITGDETFDQFETQLEKGPYAVLAKKISCVQAGEDI